MGALREMTYAAFFLASPAESSTNSTNLGVDGAMTRGVHL
jgi:hypothetical protein